MQHGYQVWHTQDNLLHLKCNLLPWVRSNVGVEILPLVLNHLNPRSSLVSIGEEYLECVVSGIPDYPVSDTEHLSGGSSYEFS